MSSDWGGKLLDLTLGGLPAIARVLPPHWRMQAVERLRDFNPLTTIATNDDLMRALRLAWIEAALEVDAAAQSATEFPELHAGAADTERFSEHLRSQLRDLRHQACNRNELPGCTAIDVLLEQVLLCVPEAARDALVQSHSDVLTDSFVPTLASITGWPQYEVPGLYSRLAVAGLPLKGGSASVRTFGELVFSAFAEIIKSPSRYPEAGKAFEFALAGISHELALATLQGINGLDSRIDSLLLEIRSLPIRDGGLAIHLERMDTFWSQRWIEMIGQAERMEEKLDESAALATSRHETNHAILQKILTTVQAQGQVGAGPNQLAYEALLALARRLKPDELLDFDRAVKELNFTIDVALQVKVRGEQHLDDANRFVDEVLQQVAELTEAGRLEQGAESIDDALIELDRREAQQREIQRLQRVGLLEAAVRQGVLLRDSDRVANAVCRLTVLSSPDQPAASAAFRTKWEEYYDEGRDQGINFSLEVAIVLAQLRLATAENSHEKSAAQFWLGLALSTLGERECSMTRLEEAVQVYRAALVERIREHVPLDWATTQNNLGTTLLALGERENGTERLKEAAQAFRAALGEFTREREPLKWAATKNNLGIALWSLGKRETGTAGLEEAVQAYKDALKEYTRERVPLDWATTQSNLGNTLRILGQREGCATRLNEAVQAFRAALEELTRKRVPLKWAAAQNNLGKALLDIGHLESGTERLEESVQAYQAALEEYTRERVPLDWAMTQNNLGNTLLALGERERGTTRLEEAVQACRAALEERTRARVPLDWATTQFHLGNALSALGHRENGTARLEEAIQVYRAALEERTRESVPLEWATTQNSLGNTLWALGHRESGTTRLEEAVKAYRAALEERTRERVPLDWATTQNNLGNALLALGHRETGTTRLKEAVQTYRTTLEERTRERAPRYWAMTQHNLGIALVSLGQRENGTAQLEEAVQAYHAALKERLKKRAPLDWAATQENLGFALSALGHRESGTARLEEAVKAYRAALEEYAADRWPERFSAISSHIDAALALIERRRNSI